jgi:uncharacterized membrane protein YbhN (UPF0104 family)
MSDPSGREDLDPALIEDAVSVGRHPARSLAITALQLVGCGLVVWLVVSLHLVDFSLLSGLLDHPGAIVAVFAASLLTIPLAGFRWYLLLRAQAVDVRFLPTLRITAIAAAGNALSLGGIGGEVARIAYAARQAKGQRTAALTSIAIDRMLAMLGVLVIGSATVPLLGAAVSRSPVLAASAVFLVGGMAAAAVAVSIAVLAVGTQQIAHLVETWVRPRALARTILRTFSAVAHYRARWRVLVAGAAISTGIALAGPISLYILCRTQNAADLGGAGLTFATSFATIANLLPIAPGGLGVGEGVFAQVCVLLGGTASAAQYGTVFLGNRAISTLAFLVGLIAMIGQPSEGDGSRRRS